MPLKIVVLTKPVPDPAAAAEKLGQNGLLERAASPAVINGNDEYTLEAALKLADSMGAEVTLVAMAPASGLETMRKGLAMGAHRGVLVTDPALVGSDQWSTVQVLEAALRTLEYDLILAGFDTSDGVGGVVGAALATRLKLPYLSSAAKIEPDPDAGTVRVRRISATGFDVLEAKMPALIVGTQLLGEPRYPSLKGIMAARSKEVVTKSLADLGLDLTKVGGTAARTKVTGSTNPPARGATQVDRGTPQEGARALAELLASRRLICWPARRARSGSSPRSTRMARSRRARARSQRSRERLPTRPGWPLPGSSSPQIRRPPPRSLRATSVGWLRSPTQASTDARGRRLRRSGQRRFSPPSRPPQS